MAKYSTRNTHQIAECFGKSAVCDVSFCFSSNEPHLIRIPNYNLQRTTQSDVCVFSTKQCLLRHKISSYIVTSFLTKSYKRDNVNEGIATRQTLLLATDINTCSSALKVVLSIDIKLIYDKRNLNSISKDQRPFPTLTNSLLRIFEQKLPISGFFALL